MRALEQENRTVDKDDILSIRLSRHNLVPQLADEAAYMDLFRLLQPVSTIHNTCPGEPPSLTPRTTFDDKKLTDSLRGSRDLVKGRFLGGGIGYVLASDLQIYANAFRRPLIRFNENQQLVMAALRSCGPLTPRQIKEETGLLNKEIMPALHRMQKGFLVFEDQLDNDWERSWYLFEEEWPEVVLSDDQCIAASFEVLSRFLRINVFATFEQIRDWTRFPVHFLKTLTGSKDSIFMLHKADPLVKAHATELKRLFGHEETLQYLLLDGELKGAVLGHWRIGQHDVEDVAILLPLQERNHRRKEILSVISRGYSPPHSRILNYCGEKIS
jgi:hypothetical protein